MDDSKLWQTRRQNMPKGGRGVYIVNEGNFMYQNASLSYYDIENKEVYNSVFFNSNGFPLGDVAQSVSIHQDLAYVVVNNSGKIYVFNVETFEYQYTINGLTSPRYIHFVSDTKAYISDLYANSISILNVETHEIVGTINLKNKNSDFSQHNAEQFVQFENNVFVNSWNFDNKILIINSLTDKIVDSVTVHKQPQSMVLDRFEKLWVLCDGGLTGSAYGHETPALVRINVRTKIQEVEHLFSDTAQVSELAINSTADTLYFLNRNVYRMSVLNDVEPQLFFKNSNTTNYLGGFYGLGIDPINKDIYVADAGNFLSSGRIFRLNSQSSPIDTFHVGIIPGSFCFK